MKKFAILAGVALCCVGMVIVLIASGVFEKKTWQEKAQLALCDAQQYALAQMVDREDLATDPAAAWGAMALFRSDLTLPEGFAACYVDAVAAKLDACGGDLIGDSSKFYGEYSRAILVLTAAGYDASNFHGYDLTQWLNDFDQTVRQGVHGAAFALLALDSGNYDCSLRQDYINHILDAQLDDGGWVLGGAVNFADTDVTAICLQALAAYTNQAAVAQAVEAGISCLSNLQQSDGSYMTYGTANPESAAQVVLAMCQLGIGLEDERFVKNGNTVLDAILRYQQSDGGFAHLADQDAAMPITTYQSMMAMVSLLRFDRGDKPLYTMS